MSRIPLVSIFFILCGLSACAPISQKSERQHQAEIHYTLATAHLQANNPTLALKELLDADKLDPHNSAVQIALAQAYQYKKAYSLAETHYLKALELSKDDPRYQNNLATLYLDMGEWDKAISYFDKASKNLLFLNSHVAIAGKAFAYSRKKDYENALKYFKEVHLLAPTYAPAYFHQSEVYRALGDPDMEMLLLQRTIEFAPEFNQARYRLAVLLMDSNSIQEAKQEFKTIIKSAPASEWGIKARNMLKAMPVF